MTIPVTGRKRTFREKAEGFVLLEALIAVMIFTIGVFGLMGLQASSIRAGVEAQNRTEATLLANQILGDIWTRMGTGAALDDFDGTYSSSAATNAGNVAWKQVIGSRFPAGTGWVDVVSATATNEITITVSWLMPGEVAATGTHSYSFKTQVVTR